MWFEGNSSSRILKKVRPTLVATFLLNGGLYEMTLRGRFFLEYDERADISLGAHSSLTTNEEPSQANTRMRIQV